jgi:hypothetical protein
MAFSLTSEVKISFGDLPRLVSKEALESRSKLITDPSMSLQEYHFLSPVHPESLDQFLAWLECKVEMNTTAANIFDFSLLSEEFGVLELVAKCDISFVSNFQNSSQQIEAIWNRIGRLEGWKTVFRYCTVTLRRRPLAEQTFKARNRHSPLQIQFRLFLT